MKVNINKLNISEFKIIIQLLYQPHTYVRVKEQTS